jgi:hypothetical protein
MDSSRLLWGKSSGKRLPASSQTVRLLGGAGNRAVVVEVAVGVAVGAVVVVAAVAAAELEAEAAATAVEEAVVGTPAEMGTAAGAETTTVAATEGAIEFALKPRPFRADQDR